MFDGLCDATSVGRWGRYYPNAGNEYMGLNTCVLFGLNIFAFGANGAPIGAPAVGRTTTTSVVSAGWTGQTVELTSDGDTQRIDLRASLPGAMFTCGGTTWGFDWVVKLSPSRIELLPGGEAVRASGTIDSPPRIMLATGRGESVLIILSHRPKSLDIMSHEHWRLTFKEPGVRVMFVPLLDECDAPRTASQAQLWLDLIAAPPVACRERFAVAGDTLTITSEFVDPDGKPTLVAPLPPTATLCGEARGLQRLPESTPMLTTPLGPYAVVPGSTHERTIDLAWTRSSFAASRQVSGELSEAPSELTYAGDATWDESTPMDALLSARQWAPLAGIAPDDIWRKVRGRIKLPTPQAFAASLRECTEAANGRTWKKERNLFDQCGEISYDSDWYNGLTLSGLRRAAECDDESLASEARQLAAAVKPQRASMMAYYEIYNDWALGAPWTDPRGEVWDLDCSHNGLEGILGEAQLRRAEGDHAGADFALYLAGKMAVSFIAAFEMGPLGYRLGHYVSRSSTNDPQTADDIYYIRTFEEIRGPVPETPASKSQVIPAPDFPEYAMLVREHGPVDRLRELAARYVSEHPERYSDWLAFYVGNDVAAAIRAAKNDVGFAQERREQAAVFYHVAHDTCLRLWVLGDSGDAIEKLYAEPMPLTSQLLCRADAKLVGGQ